MAYFKYYIKHMGESLPWVKDIDNLFHQVNSKEGRYFKRRYFRTKADAITALREIYVFIGKSLTLDMDMYYLEWDEDMFLYEKTVYRVVAEKHYGKKEI